MTRSDFQQLAGVRIDEANVLFAAKKWSGAYYLAGYAVECALKACIAKLTKADDFPPQNTNRDYYTHDIKTLIRTARLDAVRIADGSTNLSLEAYWNVVELWSEQSRYNSKSELEARDLLKAVDDPTDGVLQWIRQHW